MHSTPLQQVRLFRSGYRPPRCPCRSSRRCRSASVCQGRVGRSPRPARVARPVAVSAPRGVALHEARAVRRASSTGASCWRPSTAVKTATSMRSTSSRRRATGLPEDRRYHPSPRRRRRRAIEGPRKPWLSPRRSASTCRDQMGQELTTNEALSEVPHPHSHPESKFICPCMRKPSFTSLVASLRRS